MIFANVERHTLANGLRVICDYDPSSAMACANIMYRAGGKYTPGRQAGLAHITEHMMFGGSRRYPDYDLALDAVGGTNNAYTSDDFANYWAYLPAESVQTALDLEADRMLQPLLDDEHYRVQQSVVIEEFKQTHLNDPYGHVPHLMRRAMFYGLPYGIPVIGADVAGIEALTADDVRHFHHQYYTPDNAVLCVSGGVKPDECFRLAEQCFADIPPGAGEARSRRQYSPLVKHHYIQERRPNVPAVAFVTSWPMQAFGTDEYYAADLMTDLLSAGNASRLNQRLLLGSGAFISLDIGVMALEDGGLLTLSARMQDPTAGIREVQAHMMMVIEEMRQLATPGDIHPTELQRVLSHNDTQRILRYTSRPRRAEDLCRAVLLGYDLDAQPERYRAVTIQDIQRVADTFLRRPSATVVTYPQQ